MYIPGLYSLSRCRQKHVEAEWSEERKARRRGGLRNGLAAYLTSIKICKCALTKPSVSITAYATEADGADTDTDLNRRLFSSSLRACLKSQVDWTRRRIQHNNRQDLYSRSQKSVSVLFYTWTDKQTDRQTHPIPRPTRPSPLHCGLELEQTPPCSADDDAAASALREAPSNILFRRNCFLFEILHLHFHQHFIVFGKNICTSLQSQVVAFLEV